MCVYVCLCKLDAPSGERSHQRGILLGVAGLSLALHQLPHGQPHLLTASSMCVYVLQMVYNPNLVVVIDVRGISGKGPPKSIGWTLLPVFEERTRFVASGYYQLPLFSGAVPSDLLDKLVRQTLCVLSLIHKPVRQGYG